MPGFQRAAQFQVDATRGHVAEQRKAEFKMRGEPGGVKGVAGLVQVSQHVLEIHLHKGR
ncbi:hypothetical protein D3C71_2145590 [compost metagenome]